MEKNVIRCIHSANMRDIKNDNYTRDQVGVYYGFHNYSRTAQQILELIDIIKGEIPGVKMSNLEVYEITRGQSDRHAHYTMVQVYVNTNVVRDNLRDYITL